MNQRIELTHEQQDERDRLVIECMALGYIVNRTTPYCVFVDFSGHVDSLSIKICSSKDRYNEDVCETEFNINGRWTIEDLKDPNSWMKLKRDILKEIAKTKDVPLDNMQREVEQIYTHHF